MAETANTPVEETKLKASQSYLTDLMPALKRLDALLQRAAVAARAVYGPEAATDRFRGLYISDKEVERLLARAPGEPLFRPIAEDIGAEAEPGTSANISRMATPDVEETALTEQGQPAPGFFSFISRWLGRGREEVQIPPIIGQPERSGLHVEEPPLLEEGQEEVRTYLPSVTANPQMAWLQNTFDLTPFDLDVILIALAPELDTHYERLYAYLQDDVSRRRPSIDLILNLLCDTADLRLDRRARFTPQAPLVHYRLIHLVPDRDEGDVPLLTHYIKLDGQITRFLLQQQTLDARLAPFCRLLRSDILIEELALPAAVKKALSELVANAWKVRRPLHLYFHGPPGNLRRLAAEALANEVEAPLLAVDLEWALVVDRDFSWVPHLLFREAGLQSALLYLEGIEALADEAHQPARERLLEAMSTDVGITVMGSMQPWVPSAKTAVGVLPVSFPLPDVEQRQALWRSYLQAAKVYLEDDELARLAGRFRLTPTQIAEATTTALQHARWHGATESEEILEPSLADLFAAARAQTGHDLAALAPRIEPVFRWQDIILPDDTRTQLQELVQRVDQRHRVLSEWGFESKLSCGKGINALFAGPSGTGKTMAAEIIAAELGLDLYKIDLSGVVSKYIGETEKNLDRIFRAAENSNAILFFDEADALFGKRSEVRDSHDRYANIEISYLLQKMEEHDGITILATNLRQNLDEAFVRRLAFMVHFPFPDEDSRLRIWQGIWPSDQLLADDVDLKFLASKYKLSGGNIRNVALATAFLAAAEDSQEVTKDHLIRAIRREYQKMGQRLPESAFDKRSEALHLK